MAQNGMERWQEQHNEALMRDPPADSLAAKDAEIAQLRLWVRRIENINDSPATYNSDIDRACRGALYGEPMNGKINAELPPPPEKD